jgi:uncharacterized protein (DUF1778 family)
MKKKKSVREAKEEVFNVRCTTKQKEALDAVAASEGLGLSSWVLRAALLAAEAKEERR